jgi:multidrug efflux pump subunit AcrA (membrane-fusion protein)
MKRKPLWRRILRAVIPLALLAGAAYGGVRYYRTVGPNGGRPIDPVVNRVKAWVQPKPETPEFVPTTTVRKGDFAVSLTVVGNLKAAQSVPVSSETNGTLVWLVPDGTSVKKDDVLAVLQGDQLQRQIDQKHVELVNAEAKLADTKRGRTLEWENAKTQLQKTDQELAILKEANKSTVAQAKAALEFQRTELSLAEAQLAKQQRLADERLVPRTTLETEQQQVASKKFAVEKAQAALVLQENQLASEENQKSEEVNRARFAADIAKRRIDDEVRNAQMNVETLKRQEDDFRDQLKKSTIHAPSDGVVVLEQRWEGGVRQMRAGDQVSPRQKLLELPNLDKMTAIVEIEEKDIGAVRRGLPVRITLDPFPGALFHGTVTSVATIAKQASIEGSGMEGTKSTFTTTIDIRESDRERLRPGMNAALEILGATLKNVVYVPADALFPWKGSSQALYMRQGDRFRRLIVRPGRRNRDYVIIPDAAKIGLRPGQHLALIEPPPEGMRR